MQRQLALTFARHCARAAAVMLAGFIFCKAQPAAASQILLSDAAVHTVSGELLSPGFVLIEGSVIKGVAAKPADLKPDRNAQKISLKGLHLYPGLIGLNTALGLVEISAVRATRDVNEVGEFTPDVQSWIAVNPDSELIPVARANGLAYFQPAPQGGMVAGQSGLVATDGWTSEQMAVVKPVALHIYWPSMALNTTPKEEFKDKSKWKSLEDQAKERQEKIRELSEFFDDARAYAKAREAAAKTGAEFAANPPWEAMLPWLRGELPLMIHADDVRQIKSAVNWAETNFLKMVLAGGRDAWQVAGWLAEKKVPVLYEHVFTQPARATDPYDIHFKAPELLRKAGVHFAIGMGATTFDAGLMKNLPYSAAQAVAFGLPKTEAIKSVTLYPAQLIGVADRFGSIEPSKQASLFAADGDILDIRANVQRLWIEGKEVPIDTRHTRLYEKYKNRPRPQ